MLKHIIEDLALWLYDLNNVFNAFPSYPMEEWDKESRADLDASFYLAEVISTQMFQLAE